MTHKPHHTSAGHFIHMCMSAAGCDQWGAFGFEFGAVFFCAAHKDEYTSRKDAHERASRETLDQGLSKPKQGRLL